MPPQEGRDGLGQLVLGVAGDGGGLGADEQHQPQQVPLRQNGGGHVGQQLVAAVGDGEGLPLAGVLVDAAALHDLLQLGGDALAHQLPFAAAGHGNDRVPVRHGADAAGGAAHSVAQLPGKVLHAPQQGVFLENDLAVPAGVDLQRVALPDAHGTADLLGNDDSAQIVPLCQVGAKKIYKLSEKPFISMVLGDPDGATMRLRGFDRLCYFRSKFDRFTPK